MYDKVTITSKIHLINTPQLEICKTNPLLSGPLLCCNIKRGVTTHPLHIGGAKVALNWQIFTKITLLFVNYIFCHFGTTYMDSMTGDPPFLFCIFKWDLKKKADGRFDEILTVWYF